MNNEIVCTLCGEKITGTAHQTREADFVCDECMEDVNQDERDVAEENDNLPPYSLTR